MDSNDQSFRDNFETLLALFKKLADKMSEGDLSGTNPQFAGQFKLMLNQYEMMKHMMPDDIPEKFREPFRQMMENMIIQLKNEVGEDLTGEPGKMEDTKQPAAKKAGDTNPADTTEKEILEKLSRPGLDPGEMDNLLDRLADIKSKKG